MTSNESDSLLRHALQGSPLKPPLLDSLSVLNSQAPHPGFPLLDSWTPSPLALSSLFLLFFFPFQFGSCRHLNSHTSRLRRWGNGKCSVDKARSLQLAWGSSAAFLHATHLPPTLLPLATVSPVTPHVHLTSTCCPSTYPRPISVSPAWFPQALARFPPVWWSLCSGDRTVPNLICS